MLRDQMINFLQAAVVFLLMTNALSALVAVFAMRMADRPVEAKSAIERAIERKLDGMLRRVA